MSVQNSCDFAGIATSHFGGVTQSLRVDTIAYGYHSFEK